MILSGGPGYRFSDRLTVQDGNQQKTARSVTNEHETNVRNVRNDDVRNVRNQDVRNSLDVAVAARRDWILQQLAAGRELRAPT